MKNLKANWYGEIRLSWYVKNVKQNSQSKSAEKLYDRGKRWNERDITFT